MLDGDSPARADVAPERSATPEALDSVGPPEKGPSASHENPAGVRGAAPNGEPSPSRLACLALQVAAFLVGLAILWMIFESPRGVVARVDHGNLFDDFRLHYHPTGAHVLERGGPWGGYFYTVSFAILLAPLCALDVDLASRVWGGFIVVNTLVLAFVLPHWLAPRRKWLLAAATLVVTTSIPVLHNWKWGQVSLPLVVLMAGAHHLAEKKRAIASGALLGLASSVKLFPLVFLAFSAARRDVRGIVATLAFAGALLVLLPWAVVGSEHALWFQRIASESAVGAVAAVRNDYNAQYVPSFIARIVHGFEGPIRMSDTYWQLAAYAGYAVVLGLVAFYRWGVVRGVSHPERWAFVFGTLGLPFILPTSWTHYFCFLPLVQLHLATRIPLTKPTQRLRIFAMSLLGCSVLFASAPWLSVFRKWYWFARNGNPIEAHLFALAVACVIYAHEAGRSATSP